LPTYVAAGNCGKDPELENTGTLKHSFEVLRVIETAPYFRVVGISRYKRLNIINPVGEACLELFDILLPLACFHHFGKGADVDVELVYS
jgi:hypothetical protein